MSMCISRGHKCLLHRLRPFPSTQTKRSLSSRLCLHEGHAGGLVVVWVKGRHHLAADGVEDGQGGEGPGDLPVLGHDPQLLAGLLDGAVVNQLDAAAGGGSEDNVYWVIHLT